MNELPINQIICGDNVDVLSTFPDNCIDLTVTSPPYDNLRDYQGYNFNFEDIAQQLFRVTKKGGVIVWVVGDATIDGSETLTSMRQAIYFKDVCGLNMHDTMIYQTNKPPINDRRYQAETEYMFVLTKGTLKTFNPIKIPSLHPGVRHTGGHRKINGHKTRHERKQDRTADYKVKGNVWYLPRSSKSGDEYSRDHPATFPNQLARDHILSWSNKGDIVLDPFNGSGTTCLMAKETGRQFVGIEISKAYCEIAHERLRYDSDIADMVENLKVDDFDDLLI